MPEPKSIVATRSGLYTATAVPVPLSGVSIDAEISNLCARVVVTQRYVNRESTPIEAVYLFPLDEGAAVCGFEALIDGTLVVGEVKEREEAFRMYDDAMERGDGAFLLDEERPDVFQASVGNLPPGKEALLKLTYVTELAVDRSGVRFSIPTTVSPRYAPEPDRKGVGRPDSDTLNPPAQWRVPYGLSLSIRLAMSGAMTRIESPSHPVSVAMDGTTATVTLGSRETALDRDFVLSLGATGLDAPQAWLERDESGNGTIAVAFVPQFPQESSPCDVTFLVDRSGSMQGASITEVRNALQLCLRSMFAGCRFNIVGFGGSYQSLFLESRAYDEQNLAEASAHIAGLEADLGATEILPALRFVLERPSSGSLPRQIVVLTDGEVTNTDAVLALALEHRANARIFTFGIGAGASHHLVKGLARAGGGAAEFIHPGERIEPKVVRQFGRLLAPALTNVRLDWGVTDVSPATSTIPPVFSEGRLLAYAFVNHPQPTTIRLTADSPSGPRAFEVAFDPVTASSGSAGLQSRRILATLAARARIRELEEGPAWVTARGSRQHERRASAATQEIIALSTRYGVISRDTSFVAIERRETPVHGDVQLRRVPIALTTGWGGLLEEAAMPRFGSAPMVALNDTFDASAAGDAMTLAAPTRSAASRIGHTALSRLGLRKSPAPAGHDTARTDSSSGARERASAALYALVALQHADGRWDLSSELAEAIGEDLGRMEAAIAGAPGNRDEVRSAWATALALAWLRTYAADMEAEWRLLARKAQQSLDDLAVQPPDGGTWMDAAMRFLSASSGRMPAGLLDT